MRSTLTYVHMLFIRRSDLFGLSFLLIFASSLVAGNNAFAHAHDKKTLAKMPILVPGQGLLAKRSGQVPYQQWRIPSWGNQKRYVWVSGTHDFRRYDRVQLVFYFHGTHAKDYYKDFKSELEEVASKNPRRPFLFVGFVDTPFNKASRGVKRWKAMAPKSGERPDRLLRAINQVYRAFRITFPHINKRKTHIVLAGFSGGGRVLDSVGNWLAKSPRNDLYARIFQSKLTKMLYFDCWFNPTIVETVPTLLARNPSMKIVGSVHLSRPKKIAKLLAGKLNLRNRKNKKEMIGLGGRMSIFREKSHWKAMIACLSDALDR